MKPVDVICERSFKGDKNISSGDQNNLKNKYQTVWTGEDLRIICWFEGYLSKGGHHWPSHHDQIIAVI